MNTHADKTQENKSQSVANAVSQKKNSSKSTFQFVDNRPEATAQRTLQEIANNSPQTKQAAQLQSMADNHSTQQQQPIQKKENNTGLPDNLKTGMENLSGMSLDDVKVYRNSDKPAQLQAHAYAQGTDIHLGPGQEKHLPHELGHVVQQKQGRVKPTIQMKGKIDVNDDAGLEKEADIMGAKALKNTTVKENGLNSSISNSNSIIQGQWWRSFFRANPAHTLATYRTIDQLAPVFRVDRRPPDVIRRVGFNARVLRFPMESITMEDIVRYQRSNSDNPGIVSTSDTEHGARDFARSTARATGNSEPFYLYRIDPRGLIEFPLNENVPFWQRIFYSEQNERMIVAGIEPERIELIEEVNLSSNAEMPGFDGD